MKIWQDSIIVVQLGNRAKIFVQNIGYFSGRKRKQPKKKLKHKETNLII
jgi:myo-inositol-1-phosphate synthase